MFKLKKKILAAGVISFSLLGAGCADDLASDGDEIFHDNGNTINVNEEEDIYQEVENTEHARGEQFGYVRHQKSPIAGRTISTDDMYTIDREKVADSISRMSVTLPRVQDASTLVTDEEVLIAYKTDAKDKDLRFEVADQVKKSALSVVPRWYHVYVTDDPNLMQNVENLAAMDSDMANVNTAIDDTINLMLQDSPQGREIDAGENANGEMYDEMDEMNEDDVHRINRDRQKRYDNTDHDRMTD
ncbi:YhcN/YlaJ family sporulation lipoprotein [Bacillus salacetis]|uniref:YhcN/YlaJ family sporulation lipoprotein n=1 Tax=Bacillus salacetis TaxID=2315464 RepID=UPI003BA2BB49